MNYNEMREMFIHVMNRSDVAEPEADRYLELGTTRVSRRLRAYIMKSSEDLTIQPEGHFTIPEGLLSFDSLKDRHGVIPRVAYVEPGVRGWATTVEGIVTGHKVDEVSLTFFREFDRGVPSDPETPSALPDVIVYSGLVYAASAYEDTRFEQFNGIFETLLQEVINYNHELELSGHATVRNPYEGIV